ncbi:hypothetical protein LJC30_02510 [Odoribacter sp. OttesenSCG-928-L07]|nr:hypothetical protein [Odoribacter sp. OttesenSCG-928-L07]MDL2239188.1 hypothetical protein [Bacteroidales bacterium OttesenSCG-928-L14]MDL2240532.1 hypothetical protein [Bacteroidales bacterium OttesenSCG-928-K22]
MAKFKNILIKILTVIFVVFVIAAIFIFSNKYNNRKITDIQVKVISPENRLMLLDTFLLELLSDEIEELQGANVKMLDYNHIINKLHKIEAIDTVNISCGVSGLLLIEVLQKNPIARVYLSKSDIKYLTDKGGLIKSSYYGEELLVINGMVTGETNELVNFIENDKFLKAITASILIDKNKNHILSTLYVDQPIYVGEINNLQEKSDNLRYFFEAIDDLEKYKELNLNYKNQIVAIKK